MWLSPYLLLYAICPLSYRSKYLTRNVKTIVLSFVRQQFCLRIMLSLAYHQLSLPTLSPYHLTETGPVWSLSSRGGERGSVQFTMEWHCLLSDNVSGVSWAGPDWQRWLEMNTGHFGGPSPGPWVDLWIPQLTLRGTGTPSGGYYQDNGCLFFQLAGWT